MGWWEYARRLLSCRAPAFMSRRQRSPRLLTAWVALTFVDSAACWFQEERMKKSLASLADNFNTIRTGRANPAVLDKIMVRVTG